MLHVPDLYLLHLNLLMALILIIMEQILIPSKIPDFDECGNFDNPVLHVECRNISELLCQ